MRTLRPVRGGLACSSHWWSVFEDSTQTRTSSHTFLPSFLFLPNLQLICCHPLFTDEHRVVENITDTGYPAGWATLHRGRERCCLPSGTAPEGKRFAALTGACHIVINHGHGTALALLTWLQSLMPLLRLDLERKKKNVPPEKKLSLSNAF